jgi:hypothetical protein
LLQSAGTLADRRRWKTHTQLFDRDATKETSMKNVLIASVIAAAFAAPAFAQTVATEYYVVQDASTKKCTIVDKKPTTTTTVVVGNGMYKTRTEAETGMKTVKVCTN